MEQRERTELVERLIALLLGVMPEYQREAAGVAEEPAARRYLLRCLMNVWDPRFPLPEEYFSLEAKLLTAETEEKRPVDAAALAEAEPGIALWQGDITRLAADAIVNAANSQLLGCFVPGHSCIDNAIHSAAGLRLRRACYELMRAQGHEERTGLAKLTPGFCLPAKCVLHTVGPIVQGRVTERDWALLRSCYRACLDAAREHALKTVAFCCISTGVFHFPQRTAAEIAVDEVRGYRATHADAPKVIFNVFKDEDRDIYAELLR